MRRSVSTQGEARIDIPAFGPVTDSPELPPLSMLEPFGWVFAPGPLPTGSISAEAALAAAGMSADSSPDAEISIMSGSYTEKGRYRQVKGGQRITLYTDHPVWVVTILPKDATNLNDEVPQAARHSRHTVVDARTGGLITQFLLRSGPGVAALLDLHAPLTTAELTSEEAVAAALAGEEQVLTGLPRSVEYGSRWRLIPGFMQVTDVWRVTFDTSSLPPASPTAQPELVWVVVVDDKAGPRWLSAAVHESPTAPDSDTASKRDSRPAGR
jgi:hypothetical protein